MDRHKDSVASDSAISLQVTGEALRYRPDMAGSMLKLLVDKSYEKRWTGATELQQQVKTYADSDEITTIRSCIDFFKSDFLESHSEVFRKGGLLAYSAIAIGMSDQEKCVELYSFLFKPVISCSRDIDARIRFYAVETMYNIVKVCREHVLGSLKEVFRALIELFADVDHDVKRAAHQLDCILKNVVVETEADATYLDGTGLMDIICDMIKTVRNQSSQQMLVSWLMVLNSIPKFNLLQYLPKFLEGLFKMLSSQFKDVQQTVLYSLKDFLNEIKFSLQKRDVDLAFIIRTVSKLCSDPESTVRQTALSWLHELLEAAGEELVPLYAVMLAATINCMSDQDSEVVSTANLANSSMLRRVESLCRSQPNVPDLQELRTVLVANIDASANSTREAVLNWVVALHKLTPGVVRPCLEQIISILTQRLSEETEQTLERTLNVICLLSNYEECFTHVIESIIGLFQANRGMMDSTGGVIIILLCSNLGTERVYRSFAEILFSLPQTDFTQRLVELLDILLLTEPSLNTLRDQIRFSFETENREQIALFETLFRTWCINPVSSVNLCFLAQAYELAYDSLLILSKAKVTVDTLTQLARLVQMLESPIFGHLRLQMLEPGKFPCLMRALYGLLMILPQSRAYAILENRLGAAAGLVPEDYSEEAEQECTEQYPDYVSMVGRFTYLSNPQDDSQSESKYMC